jgi:hypothetical protein
MIETFTTKLAVIFGVKSRRVADPGDLAEALKERYCTAACIRMDRRSEMR